MASRTGALATEAPSTEHLHASSLLGPSFSADGVTRQPKRQRESDSAFPTIQPDQQASPRASPPKSARLALTAAHSLASPLTGAAALEDERRRRQKQPASTLSVSSSPNPSHRALETLMSAATQGISLSVDAPQTAPTANMDPAVKAVAALSIPPDSTARPDERLQNEHGAASPQSVSSSAAVPGTESPVHMDVDSGKVAQHSTHQAKGPIERSEPGSLSYPGLPQASESLPEQTARGMSFPVPSQIHGSPTPSGGKKHKCPYCNTVFTRHHNLKSHLLTHSQEKPYICTECQMRFRRLHDLKRHGKLHTGEKPHICSKCDRKFARGDALARHSKGAAGCAGRRASTGYFADGDELDSTMADGDGSTMSGITYGQGDDEELRRQSLPSLGLQHVDGIQAESLSSQSRTYPPAGGRRADGGLFVSNADAAQTGSANDSSPSASISMASNSGPGNMSVSSHPAGGGGMSVYSQTGMTESPKPLSPGTQAQDTSGIARQRSSSSTHQPLQQQENGKTPRVQSPYNASQSQPQLPEPSHTEFAASGSSGPTHERAPRARRHGADGGNTFAQSDLGVWPYVRVLEDKLRLLSEKFDTLEQKVADLKSQLESRSGTAPKAS